MPTGFVLTTLLFQFFPCLNSPMTPQSYCQYLKIWAVKKHTFLVDVTLAVCALSQTSCSNVNISASAVPKWFSCEGKNTNDLSGAASSRDVFFRFSVAKFLAHTSNKLKQIKTFVQCSLLANLTWNAVDMSHEHWPHVNFTRFRKNNLGYFWPRLPKVKVFVFLGHLWSRIPTVQVFDFEHFWPRIPMVKLLFFLVIFGQGYERWKFDFWAFLAKDTNGESFCFLSFLTTDTNDESFVSSWSFLTKVSRCRCGCDVINCKEILRHRERVPSAQKDKKQTKKQNWSWFNL